MTYDPFTVDPGTYDADIAATTAAPARAGLRPQMMYTPPAPAAPRVAVNNATGDVWVNGLTFKEDDHRKALLSEEWYIAPDQGEPLPAGFTPIGDDMYASYLDGIRDPSLSRLAAKNFATGVDVTQMLAYGAAQAVGRGTGFQGLEDFGARGVQTNVEELARNEPYNRPFTDIDSVGGVGEFFVANLAQLAPSMVESVLAAGIGALAGTAVGTPGAGTIAGGVAGFLGKQKLKKDILAAAQKRLAGQELLPDEKQLLRRVGQAGGAAVASAINSYGLGVGDIFTEGEATGTTSLTKSFLGAFPYAAADLLPQFVGAGALVKGLSGGFGGSRLRRAGVGLGVGAVLEGSTEASQEVIVMAATGQLDLSNPENFDRLIDAFAAGAVGGGTLGGAGGLLSRAPSPPGPEITQEPTRAPIDTSQDNVSLLGQGELFPGQSLGTLPTGLREGQVQGELFSDVRPEGVDGRGALDGQMELPFPTGQQELDLQQPQVTPPGAGLPLFDHTPAGPRPRGQAELFPDQNLGAAPPTDLFGEQLELGLNDTRQQSFDLAPAEVAVDAVVDTAMAQAFRRAQEQQAQTQPAAPATNPLQNRDRPVATPPSRADLAEAQRAEQIAATARANEEALFAPAEAQRVAQEQQAANPIVLQDIQPDPVQPALPGLGTPYSQRLRQRRRVAPDRRAPVALPATDGNQGELFLRRGGKRTPSPPTAQANQRPDVDEADDVAAQRQADADAKVAATAARVAKLKRAKAKAEAEADAKEVVDGVQERSAEGVAAAEQAGRGGEVPVAGAAVPAAAGTGTGKQAGSEGQRLKSKRAVAPVNRGDTQETQGVPEAEPTGPKKPEPTDTFEQQSAGLVDKPTPLGRLAIQVMGDPFVRSEYTAAAQALVSVAVGEGGASNIKQEALAVLLGDELVVNDTQRQIVSEAVVAAAESKDESNINGIQTTTNGKKDGPPTTLMRLIRHYNLLEELADKVTFHPLPDELRAQAEAVVEAAESELNRTGVPKDTQAVADAIGAELDYVAKRTTQYVPGIPKDETAARDGRNNFHVLAKGLDAIGLDHIVRGEPIRNWLNAKGNGYNWVDAGSKYAQIRPRVATTKPVTKGDTLKAQPTVTTMTEAELKAAYDAEIAKGNHRRLGTDEVITRPMPMGAVKMFVSKARAAFRGAKVDIRVYKDIAELKRKDPALYKEAATRRPQGDFDTTRASGYSYDNKILIFADHIKGKQDLAFTIAHEVLGHYGMRAAFAPAQFKRLLDAVYEASVEVREGTMREMDNHGIGKYEAIEEVVADYAAWLDGTYIGMFRKAFRGFFNRLGIKFDDDLLRYMVTQSRRYVRTGETGALTPSALYDAMNVQSEKMQEGRFLREATSVADFNRTVGGAQGSMRLLDKVRLHAKRNGVKDFGSAIGSGIETIQSTSNMSGRSYGLRLVFDLYRNQTHYVNTVLAKMNGVMKTSHLPAWARGGPSQAERRRAGEMMAYWNLYSGNRYPEAAYNKALHDATPIIKPDPVTGMPEINTRAVGEAQAFAEIYRLDPKTNEYVLNVGADGVHEVRRQLEAGIIIPTFDDNNKPITETVRFKNISDKEWTVFMEAREGVAIGAAEQILSKMLDIYHNKAASIASVSRMRDANGDSIDDADAAFLRRIADTYRRLHDRNSKLEGEALGYDRDSVREASRWLVDVTRAMAGDNRLAFADWENAVAGKPVGTKPDGTSEIAQVVLNNPAEYQWVVDGLRAFRKRTWSTEQTNHISQSLEDTLIADTQAINGDLFARSTIMAAYSRFERNGKYQIKVVAINRQGLEVDLPGELKLPYWKADDAERDVIAARVEEGLATLYNSKSTDRDGFFEVSDGNIEDPQTRSIRLEVRVDEAPDIEPLIEALDYDLFARTLTRLKIGINLEERERVIEALTAGHSAARKSLRKRFVPGWDPDVVGTTLKHLEGVAHIAGKNRYRYQLGAILAEESNWTNDKAGVAAKRLADMQREVTRTIQSGNDAAAHYAYKEMAEYQRMLRHMSSETQSVPIMDRQGNITMAKGEGRGRRYRAEANKLVDYYDTAIGYANDPLTGFTNKWAGTIATTAVAMQLGMNIATSAINLGSLATHAIPYLAVFNPKIGYGGGFGTAKATAAVFAASKDMIARGMADPTFVTALGDKGRTDYKKYGLTKAEYEMIRDLTQTGTLQANLQNAMLGTASATRKLFGPALEKWMIPFTVTEQYNRRVTALASYRLERARMEAMGVDFADPVQAAAAQEKLLKSSTDAVNYSQGEYAQYNRPSLSRDHWSQFLFIYKQFIIITVENMRNMGLQKETGYMLVALAVLAGLKGLPFGEDLMDLVDTLAQKFGIQMEPVEVELAKMFDAILPGSARYILNGPMDQMIGTVVSSRLSLGNLLPLTGMGKAGASWEREVKNFFGPAFSASDGLLTMASRLGRYGAEVVGLRDDTSSLRDILRDSPIAGLRAATDALTYMVDGSIINTRGQVISKDVGVWDIVTRALGFYPKSAAEQYDIIRLGKQTRDYAMAIKTEYVYAHNRATSRGDREGARKVERLVADWNRTAQGTPFYFRNFAATARRAGKEASYSALDRYLKTAPLASRPATEQIIELYGMRDYSEFTD